MSVASVIESMKEHVKDAYKSLQRVGADLANTDKNINNISDVLDTIYDSMPKVSGKGTDIELFSTRYGGLNTNITGNTYQNTVILPSEYQQVEYIESTGTQWIDTGIKLKTNTVINIDIQFNYMTDSRWFGDNTTVLAVNSDRIPTRINSVWDDTHISTIKADIRYKIDLQLNSDGSKLYIDDNLEQDRNQIAVNETIYNAYIGTVSNTNVRQGVPKFKLYRFKISQDNYLNRDFIPCYRKSDNVIGMYDLVNGVFYTNDGTGTFLKGNDVTILNPEYSQPIKVVKGQNNVKIENKNRFDNNNYEKGYSYIGTTKSANANWGIYNLECLKDEEYVISGLKPYANVSIVQLDKNKNPIVELQRRNSTNITYTITATEDGFIAVTFLWNEAGQGSELNTMQIEKDTTSSPYVPHQEQNYPITLPEGMELASNPTGTVRDRIYGTPDNWYFEKKIGKVVLDGSENLNFNASLTNVNRFNTEINGFKNILSSSSGYCNQLPILNSFDGDSEHIYIYNDNCFIFYNKNRCADVNELKTYLHDNNLILYGTLATSTTTPITDTTLIQQLNDLYYSTGYKNYTHVISISSENNTQMVLEVDALEGTVTDVLEQNY